MRNEPQRLNTVTTRTKEAMLNGLRLQMTADDYCDCGTNNSAVIRPLQAEFCDTRNSPKNIDFGAVQPDVCPNGTLSMP